MTYHDPATTYAEALENLTEENWHTERALIEAEVARLLAEIKDVAFDTASITGTSALDVFYAVGTLIDERAPVEEQTHRARERKP